ncbi:MAG: acylphosphatase [Dissulfurimicrobium sp.]|uniref:acylphosphatase n=1 Tax=Dissulfurimicrobium TaxID=1769732 RepID=UPI001ED9C887|nr:acylphosphatase [Dissulfurimicrobium hydrothermale]UKL12861.1 acylphosphatase [Dissulfurimicrobium hydrothermale]
MGIQRRIHAFISGRVQGVFYRASAMDKAMQLDLTGWVKNLADGRVELVAEGSSEAIDAFISWCRKGPPYAHVTNIEVQEQEATGEFDRFSMRY